MHHSPIKYKYYTFLLVLVSTFLKLNHYTLLARGSNDLPKFKERVRTKIKSFLHSKSYI